ncbi:GDP-L-fucose synthase 1 [Candidatus Curtissbacteria bacterium RBG_13_35_7]|uniref:GDP-L-fucose synthase 1 n=1 Tax=Candidatus Curtissbacteria bacterium RBG_13_35_7 TaxID=1797705 RepID=A0A1F5G2T0_9BACT|nr:MAG: GDP-L-fucose synthase 1 [Candidatus Curtissbacteria bacterium RBG_13_35_7]
MSKNSFLKNKKVLVTGGASFIGSHLTERLSRIALRVRVVDDLSSGKLENIKDLVKSKSIEFIKADLRESSVAQKAVKNMNYVFHLAGDHGGRGYVDLHQAACATNLMLDGNVFWTAKNAGCEKIVFASSGCVYPNFLQTDHKKKIYLKEKHVGPPYDADNMYGWAKLMAEMTLKAYHDDWGMKTASCRFFTVYGPRGKEDHAVIAMIARAFIKQNPFYVWGDGKQIRNWTYVADIIDGIIKVAEKIDGGQAINLGTMERIKIIDAVKMILKYTNHNAKIVFQPNMPTGPVNRVADNSLAQKLLGWKPKVKFKDGLKRTIDWYFTSKDPKVVTKILKTSLTER